MGQPSGYSSSSLPNLKQAHFVRQKTPAAAHQSSGDVDCVSGQLSVLLIVPQASDAPGHGVEGIQNSFGGLKGGLIRPE